MFLNFQQLAALEPRLRDAAVDGVVTLDALAIIAADEAIPHSHAVAALALAPALTVAREHETLVEVCIQDCQLKGSVATLGRLLDERKRRVAQGLPALDVKARPCLDACNFSPALKSQGPLGIFLHPRTTPEVVAELAAALLDNEPDSDAP